MFLVANIFAPNLVAEEWVQAWLPVYERFERQEKRARKLVDGLSRNREARRSHAQAIVSFLKAEGVDPDQLFERGFGSFMELSPTASLLAEAYRHPIDERIEAGKVKRPMLAAKAAFQRWGFLHSPTWCGFLLHHFEWFPNPVYVHPRDAFEPRRDVPRLLYPSDVELAAISVVLFHSRFSKEGLTLVPKEDVVARATTSAVLARHRGVVARAHDHIVKARGTVSNYEGEEQPPKNERGISRTRFRAVLPWPTRRAGKAFADLVPEPAR